MTVATIRLHKSIYLRRAIADAMATFEDFGTFELSRDGDHHQVLISAVDPEVEGDIVGEFCNFALANTIERKRKVAR